MGVPPVNKHACGATSPLAGVRGLNRERKEEEEKEAGGDRPSGGEGRADLRPPMESNIGVTNYTSAATVPSYTPRQSIKILASMNESGLLALSSQQPRCIVIT